jgi:hypothetical protein
MDRHECIDTVLVDDWHQLHTGRRWHVEGEVRDLGDEQGLCRLGSEPGGT